MNRDLARGHFAVAASRFGAAPVSIQSLTVYVGLLAVTFGLMVGAGCAGRPTSGGQNLGGVLGPASTGTTTTTGLGVQVTSNAGPDQSVEDGATVTLAGSGSDSSGTLVTFLWSQVSGPTVALTAAQSATATFTAPAQSATLVFNLAVTSINGSSNDEVTVTVVAAPILFVTNRGGNSVVRFRASPTLNGDVAPQGAIAGTAAELNGPSSLVLDKNGGLLVANADGNSIVGFPNAATSTGATPDRVVKGTGTLLAEPEGLAYDSARDLLFVGNFNAVPSAISVYANVSSASFTGNIAPTRQITNNTNQIANPRALVLAPTNEVYVIDAGANDVTVFANASTANGLTSASRTITSTEMQGRVLLDGFLDGGNRLYVVDSTGSRILIFENAPSLGLNSTPARILIVPGAVTLSGVAVDASGIGYLTDSGANAIYIYGNLGQLNGTVAPDRTVTGGTTQLASPWHMALLQR